MPARTMKSRMRQVGFTLIELMVSLVIGFAVVGALLAAYMASARSGYANDAMVQMTEDATQALNVMRSQVAMAGYSVVTGATSSGLVKLTINPLFGCSSQDFGDLTLTTAAPAACTGATTSDTIEVAYQAVNGTSAASPSNTVVDSSGTPLDCLGNAIPLQAGPTPYYLADSKFYVNNPGVNGALYCHAAGATAGAPLVDHVESMKVTYGLTNGPPATNQIINYASLPANWAPPGWIASVTICVQVRSANKVLDTTTGPSLGVYVDCANAKQTSADGYLRRTFETTVVLQNMLF